MTLSQYTTAISSQKKLMHNSTENKYVLTGEDELGMQYRLADSSVFDHFAELEPEPEQSQFEELVDLSPLYHQIDDSTKKIISTCHMHCVTLKMIAFALDSIKNDINFVTGICIKVWGCNFNCSDIDKQLSSVELELKKRQISDRRKQLSSYKETLQKFKEAAIAVEMLSKKARDLKS